MSRSGRFCPAESTPRWSSRRCRPSPAGPLRAVAASVLQGVPQSVWNRFLPGNGESTGGARVHLLGSTLRQPNDETVYRNLMSHWEDPERVVPGAVEPATAFSTRESAGVHNRIEKMMLLDALV